MMGTGPLPHGYKKAIDEYAAPDDCEAQGCSESPEMFVKYENPDERVYYCSIHGNRHRTDQNAVNWEYI